MKIRYNLDETPPLSELILFGLQWFAISIPGLIIIGRIVGALHFTDPLDQTIYLQKICFVAGLTLLCQVLWGHRLPLLAGPSTVLLIGVIASKDSSLNTIYGAVAMGGILLSAVSAAGLFGHIRRLFSPRVIAVLLLLIAMTLTPTIIRLLTVTGAGVSAPKHLCFAVIAVILMFALYRHLKGIWKSTVLLWSMAGSSVAYVLLFPHTGSTAATGFPPVVSSFFVHMTGGFTLDAGVLISFLFCYFALSVNDVASIQSISELLKAPDPVARLNRGVAFTGLANVLSGMLGIIGPVNFSLSPGVIMATGCASRFALLPAAAGLVLVSFSPLIVGFFGSIPPVVIGTMLLYILCYQVAAGLMVAIGPDKEFSLESGLAIGLPLLLGTIFSFLPETATLAFPQVLRPLVGNGFVIGVLTSLVLEHIIF